MRGICHYVDQYYREDGKQVKGSCRRSKAIPLANKMQRFMTDRSNGYDHFSYDQSDDDEEEFEDDDYEDREHGFKNFEEMKQFVNQLLDKEMFDHPKDMDEEDFDDVSSDDDNHDKRSSGKNSLRKLRSQ